MSPFIRPAAVRQADRHVALSVFLILLVLFTATQVTQPDVLDGEVEFQTTSSLVRGRTLALGGTPEADAIIAWPQGDRTGFNCVPGGPGREDEHFSWFGVGQAYVGVPFHLVGSGLARLFPWIERRNATDTHMGVQRSEYFAHLVVGWRNPLLAALTAMLVALSARRLGASRASVWIAGLSYGLCTFAWPQARSTFNSVQTTFFLFLAFHQILLFEEVLARYRRPRKLDLLLCGCALGMAFLTRSLSAPVIVVLSCALLFVLVRGYRHQSERHSFADLGWALLPALACFGLFLYTNQQRFGSPWEQGYGGVVTWEGFFAYPVHRGLAGLIAAPGKGLLWMAPGLLLFPIWFVRQIQRGDRRLLVCLTAVAAAVLVPVAMTSGWHGGVGYGPRYALPLLPFLWLAVPFVLDACKDSALRLRGAQAVLAFGFLTTLPGALVDSTTHTSLAVEGTRLAYPDEALRGTLPESTTAADLDAWRFERMQWELPFAAPWAHWRILRHRVAGLDERFRADEIFFLEGEAGAALLVPAHERERGFSHLAWVDLRQRLEGPLAPVLLFTLVGLLFGAVAAAKGLDPNRP